MEDSNKRQSQEISDLERQITSLQQDLQQVCGQVLRSGDPC